MNKISRGVVAGTAFALALTTAPLVGAQSSLPQSPAAPQPPHMSSGLNLKNPFEPSVPEPSNRKGYGLRGAIEVYLAGQGYMIDRGGAVEAQALELAKQGYNGEIRFDANGVSAPIYLPHGEGIVSRVSPEHRMATIDWYMNATPMKVHNPKRAGVETWAAPGGDIYVGQFFTYS